MNAINLLRYLARTHPGLKKQLRIAHLPYTPEEYAKRSLLMGLVISGSITFIITLFLLNTQPFVQAISLGLIIFIISYIVAFNFVMLTPSGYIRKRQREIDKDVLFAGRYLLVKIESGVPLYNALIDASRGYGIGGKYFKEIVDEINTGVPIERALDHARERTPSVKFKKILWQIIAALKTGTEVSDALRSVLKTITAEQIDEIKAYGKKLNSVMLFYMVTACVMPSIGLTILLVISTLIGLNITQEFLYAILFLFGIFQLMFIVLIKSIKPLVDL